MQINWQQNPLIPAIAQDFETNEILMLAYMNEEAYNLTLSTGYAYYFSRSKQRIWKKGESSNHTQEVKDILLDCDADTIILKIHQNVVTLWENTALKYKPLTYEHRFALLNIRLLKEFVFRFTS